MLLLAQLGQTPSLAAREIRSVAARDVAPSLAVLIVYQASVLLHTNKMPSCWGQLPAERLANITALGLSNLMLRLGGTLRLIDLLADDNSPRLLSSQPAVIADAIWSEAQLASGSGKILVGLSALDLPPSLLTKVLGELKNRARAVNRSIRVVLPGQGHSELSAASVRQNKILNKGYEFVLISLPGGVAIGQTVALHDPNRDALLDRGIPSANARSGMLPPKLARMMVNCAVSDLKEISVSDPFCGNGRILLEAALQGIPVIGRDVEPLKVEASRRNLDWLADRFKLSISSDLQVEDARSATTIAAPHVIATETWLGPPLRALPDRRSAATYAEKVGEVVYPALKALLKSRPQKVVIAVPAWRLAGGGTQELQSLLDVFRDNGYGGECIARYARSDSFVERMIFEANPK